MPTPDPQKPQPALPQEGIIVIADIVDFSIQPANWQCEAVGKLWAFVREDDFLKENKIAVNGTGDGILLAFTDASALPDHHGVLQMAKRWINWMITGIQVVNMRTAVHRGQFRMITVGGLAQDQIIGTGVNHCARLTSVGDAGHIAVSEEFIRDWIGWHGVRVLEVFWPATPNKALSLEVKHGERIHFRLWAPDEDMDKSPPKKVQLSAIVAGLIFHSLGQLADDLHNALKELDPALDNKFKLAMRVTIYRPDTIANVYSNQKALVPYMRLQVNSPAEPYFGGTVYLLEGEGHGLPAIAFIKNAPRYIHNLPDSRSRPADLQAYVDRVQAETNLSEKTIRRFGNKPQAMMALPLGLNPIQADGALCIDVDNPLTNIDAEAFDLLSVALLDTYGAKLAALLRI